MFAGSIAQMMSGGQHEAGGNTEPLAELGQCKDKSPVRKSSENWQRGAAVPVSVSPHILAPAGSEALLKRGQNCPDPGPTGAAAWG